MVLRTSFVSEAIMKGKDSSHFLQILLMVHNCENRVARQTLAFCRVA